MSEKDNQETNTPEEMVAEQEPLEQEGPQENQEGNNPPEGQAPEAGATLEEEYQNLKADHNDLKDKYLRLLAEFDNYKKRAIRERLDLMKTAAQDTLSALLPVLDDFDRAQKAAAEQGKSELFDQGVGLVYKKLFAILNQRGLVPMESDGQAFDPEQHEALTEIPAPSETLKGHIIDTIEKGYKLNDKIIRHAKVVVGK